MKIVIVEDDARLRKTVAKALQLEGYTVEQCADGDEALYYMENNACDLVVLDRMLPALDGLGVLKTSRGAGIHTPVLMMSALGAVGDRVAGLDAGADDYLPKPFEMEELLARVRALIRRPAAIEQTWALAYGDVSYIPLGQTLGGPGGTAKLSRREGELMELFMRSGGEVLTRQTIFSRVWGPASGVEEGSIATYVHFLRRRLAAVGSTLQFVNHRGVGFSLEGGGGKP